MKIMKYSFCLFLCVVFAFSTSVTIMAASEPVQELNVYNWGVYMDTGDGKENSAFYDKASSKDINKAFEKWYKQEYGITIKVNYSTFENNEAMYQKLVAGGAAYDIVVPSDYMVNRLIKEERLEKLDFSKIPNYKYIDDAFKGDDWKYDETHEYTVPYMWGYVGLVYNTDYVTGAVNTWDVLWDEAYKGKILMFNNPRDAFMVALGKNGYSLNTTNAEHWKKAYEDLVLQKPLVQGYVTDQVFDKMQSGEAYIAPCYYGDYQIMKAGAEEHGVNLAFNKPSSQPTNKFVDSFCIPVGCQNKEAAHRYIDFMCSYEAGVINANYTGYASPLTNVRNNEGDLNYHYAQDIGGVYPSETQLKNCEEYLYLGTGPQTIMDNYWKDLKKSEAGLLVYLALGAVLVLAASILIYRKIKQKRQEELQKQARQAYDQKRKNHKLVKEKG